MERTEKNQLLGGDTVTPHCILTRARYEVFYLIHSIIHPSIFCTSYPTQGHREPRAYSREVGNKAGDTLDGVKTRHNMYNSIMTIFH